MAGRGAAPIGGSCDPAFAAVADAFRDNFAHRGELGAAVAVTVGGRRVADLWGGWARTSGVRPWERDTLVNVFSVGKAVAALCVARLCSQGKVAVDDPVSRHWPEFGAAGKVDVTVAQLLAHQAGLPSVRKRLPPGAMLHPDVMGAALADQEPWWEPGTAHGYHTNTFGFLVGELVRRVEGRSVGSMVRDEIAGPLGADFFIGLPDPEHDRVAEFLWPGQVPPEAEPNDLPDSSSLMEYNAYWNPSGLSGAGVVNTPEWRRAEIPSTNGHATARGVARIYEALAGWGRADGINLVERETLETFTSEWSNGEDLVLHRPSRFGLGFQLSQPERRLGPGDRGYGHFGAGGSLGFCDPDAGVAFGYVINSMGPRWQNPRNRALIDAVYDSIT